jgi:hypothetical protein
MLRISFFTILLLTGCQDKQVQNPVIGQIQQIESRLQNTVDGMAKAFDNRGASVSNSGSSI